MIYKLALPMPRPWCPEQTGWVPAGSTDRDGLAAEPWTETSPPADTAPWQRTRRSITASHKTLLPLFTCPGKKEDVCVVWKQHMERKKMSFSNYETFTRRRLNGGKEEGAYSVPVKNNQHSLSVIIWFKSLLYCIINSSVKSAKAVCY